MHRILRYLILLTATSLQAQPRLTFEVFATGFDRPVDIAHCGDNRLFIVEQDGIIWVLDSAGNRLPEAFLNIDPRVQSTGNEQGLLGLAFHPNYQQNGYFYVYYTRTGGGDTRVSRFTVSASNPNVADPNSELILLDVDQPFSNHNGGCLKFSPVDGYLYISLGDGGSAGDPQNNGQKKNTHLGKILRIDVNAGAAPYAVPADNPFVNDPAFLPEIWSLGWRNPWRFSFDRLTGDMWIGDVGQNAREEVDFEPAGIGGRNYGWRCYEGTVAYNTNGCAGATSYTAPVFDYLNPSIGCSITGGFIYRGSRHPAMYGYYLVTDFCSGRWWAIQPNDDGSFTGTQIANLTDFEYSALGEDLHGELYVAELTSGNIQRIQEICSPFKVRATTGGPICEGLNNGSISLDIAGDGGSSTILWSNGATVRDLSGLSAGTYKVTLTNADNCVITDSVSIVTGTPNAPLAMLLSGNPVVCAGDTVELTATPAPPGLGYQWYRNGEAIPGADQAVLSTIPAGMENLQVVFLSGNCVSEISDTIVVSAVNQPLVSIQPSDNTILCALDSVGLQALVAPDAQSFAWYKDGELIADATDDFFLAQEAGNYQVVAESACGVDTAEIVVETEIIAAPVISRSGDSLNMIGLWSSYEWYLFGVAIQGAVGPAIDVNLTGVYTCAVVSENGCPYTASFVVDILDMNPMPAVVQKCSLSPNPTRAHLQLELELSQTENIRLSLFDEANRTIFTQTLQADRVNKRLDLSALPAGTYFLHVQLDSGKFNRKIVKY